MEVEVLNLQPPRPFSKDTNSSKEKAKLISEWIVRFALNADKPLDAKEQAVYRTLWEEGFEDLGCGRLRAAFVACLRALTFKTMPTIGDVRQHLQKAESNASEEEATLKWDRVLTYAVRQSPDVPDRNPPRIKEQTQRAINAAGGLSWIRECDCESLTWARKRFIESYIRYSELEQNQFLLPEGEIKNLIANTAEAKLLR